MRPTIRGALLAALAAPLPFLAAPAPLAAQTPDFKFHQPRVTVTVMGGVALPGEESDLFAFTREELTVDRGAFRAPLVMGELGVRLTERLDLALGMEWASRTVDSEMEDWVWQDDSPITQSTEFSRRRVLGSVKGYLFPRGRRISQYAWVPNRWSPYVGAGAGVSWFTFEQNGDFVDYQTLDIFEDRFTAEGRGTTTHVLAGVDVNLNEDLLLRGEYRYIWGEGRLEESDFVGFGNMDLSGSRLMLGLGVRM